MPDLLSSAYRRLPLNCRLIVTVNSGELYWLNEGKDKFFPLLPGSDLDPDTLTLIIEARGYLVLPNAADCSYEELGPYQRFEVQFLGYQVAQMA